MNKNPKRKLLIPSCPKCGCREAIKSGFVQGGQRWKCKDCQYQYTRLAPRGRPLWQKSLAVFLYSYNVSLHTIAGILHIQPSTVLKWVRSYTKDFQPTQEKSNIRIGEMDQMRKYLKSAKGSGVLCIAIDNAAFQKNIGITIGENLA